MLAWDGFGQHGLWHVGATEGAEPDDDDAPRVVLERLNEADEERRDGEDRRDEYDCPPPTKLDGYSVESWDLTAAISML